MRSPEDHFAWNFKAQLDKMRASCSSWNNRALLLKGKVTVYNTLMISLLQYVCANSTNVFMGQCLHLIHNKHAPQTIRQSVPHSWRTLLTAGFQDPVNHKFKLTFGGKQFDLLNSSPKAWYAESVRRLRIPFSRADKWTRDLGLQQIPDWEAIFSLPYKTFRETKLQAFSFKTLYRLTPCKHYLHTVRISETSTCSHCSDEDTIVHFLIRCPQTRTFWDKKFRWCEDHVNISLTHLSDLELLFGISDATGS